MYILYTYKQYILHTEKTTPFNIKFFLKIFQQTWHKKGLTQKENCRTFNVSAGAMAEANPKAASNQPNKKSPTSWIIIRCSTPKNSASLHYLEPFDDPAVLIITDLVFEGETTPKTRWTNGFQVSSIIPLI